MINWFLNLFKNNKRTLPIKVNKPKVPAVLDFSKSEEQLFIDVAVLCAKGNCSIDLKYHKIKGLTLIFGDNIELINGVIEVIIPITTYPGSENVSIIGNRFIIDSFENSFGALIKV